MHVAYALICAAMLYGVFYLVGRAAVGIFCNQLEPNETRSISSVVGLAILSLFSTYIVLLDVPLKEVSKNVTLTLTILSIAILFFLKRPLLDPFTISNWFWKNIPFWITVSFLSLPFVVGGYEFAILRGNGTDSFNYVTMADALSHFPLDWILKQPKEVLATYSPNLPLAHDLLQSRWTTSALLAFGSSTFGISPVEFEFTFTLALMLVLYDALVAALSVTSSHLKASQWLPVAFVAGFWGQFILDLRAFSQMGAMPILALLIGWLLSPLNSSSRIFRYGVLLTAILVSALCFQYPEIVIPFLPGAGLIFLLRVWRTFREKNSKGLENAKNLIGFSLVTILLITPIVKFLFEFVNRQTHLAIGKSLGWEWAYFTWMLKNPISGFWGLGVNPDLGIFLDNVFFDFALLISLGLIVVVVARSALILSSFQQFYENLQESLLLFLAATGFFGAFLLIERGNNWAAGKVLTYFSFLIPIWLGQCLLHKRFSQTNLRFNKTLSLILVGGIFGWCVLNFIFAGARVIHAAKGKELSSFYIAQHGEHHRVDAGIIAQIPEFDCPMGSSVAIFEPTVWEREFLTHLTEGRGFSALTPGNSPTRDSYTTPYDLPKHLGCVLVQNRYFDSSRISPTDLDPKGFIFKNPGRSYVALLRLSGGYGVERNPVTGTRSLWMGLQQNIKLTIGARASAYSVDMRLCPRVDRKKNNPITVSIAIDNQNYSNYEIRACRDLRVKLSGDDKYPLLKQLQLSMKDPNPEIRLNGPDPRDLRLRVEVVRIRLMEAGR